MNRSHAVLLAAASLGLSACSGADAPSGPFRVTDLVDNPAAVTDWAPVLVEALESAGEGAVLYFPGGRTYRLGAPVELTRSASFLFEASAVVRGEGIQSLFSIRDGRAFRFEGVGGQARLELDAGEDSAVIDVREVRVGADPDLTLRGLHLSGFRCVDGMAGERYTAEASADGELPPLPHRLSGGGLGDLVIEDCRFEADDIHIGHRQGRVNSVRIDNNVFTGDARMAIYVGSPIPNGALVRGNRILNVGVRGIQLGGAAANMIAAGAVDYVSSAIVHENQVLGGGHRADETVSYIMGILVYGNSISIQGNVVRDFNRGEPVPGERIGHHFPLSDGTYHRGPWIADEDRPQGRRRLAGAAIYAKGRHGIIAGNVCVNSGWRSVIEVKTGGREPYFLVANNIVDGRSLAIDDSFGFEPNVGKALWTGNVVSNMPHMAFKVSNRMQGAFTNNTIYDSRIGFAISGTTHPNPELILHNHFVNVETPVQGLLDNRFTAVVSTPAPLVAESVEALPDPGEAHRGRLAFVRGAEEDRWVAAVRLGERYAWVPLAVAGEPVRVGWADGVRWTSVGPNLALNSRQDRDGPTEAEQERWAALPQAGEFPYGWQLTLGGDRPDPGAGLGYEGEGPSGTRVLRIGGEDLPRFNWLLEQRHELVSGRVYRARAVIRRSEGGGSANLILDHGEARESAGAARFGEWETLETVFRVPEDAARWSRLRLHGSNWGGGLAVWIDEVTLEEVQAERPDEAE